MLNENDLAPVDRDLLELLRDGRITAPFGAKETGYSLQYVRDRLGRLVEHGNVKKVYDGLYELEIDPAFTDIVESIKQGARERGLSIHDHSDGRHIRIAEPNTSPNELSEDDLVINIIPSRYCYLTSVRLVDDPYWFGDVEEGGKYDTPAEALDMAEEILTNSNGKDADD
jgi:hypothetical protein